jgi:hypothetical protein
LSSLIVLKGEFLEDFFSVLRRILHCLHSCGLFRSGVVEECDPEVGGKIELIKGLVTCVLIWKGLVVKLGELHGLEESLSWHEVHVSNDV